MSTGTETTTATVAPASPAGTTGVLVAASSGSYVVALVLSGTPALVGAFSHLGIVPRIEPLPMPE